MAQTAEAQAFLRRLGELPDTPGVDLGLAITPSLQDEAELRRLFATDRDNARLKDPYVGLVDVFGENTDRIKKTHARAIEENGDLLKHHIMPLDDDTRRKDGELSMAPSMEDFKLRWSIFSEGALSQLTNWNNVIAAGGSVLACLAPLPEDVVKQGSKRAIRKYYHSVAYPASDVDLFLYGLTPEQAEEKCVEIYNAVRDSVPWEVCAVRTKNAVSIHCQYPYRPVQIVLRIYQSPAEILAGFDVDAACVAFDGTRVLAAPRAVVALMTQCNRVAMDRRSPSYEVRLAKYATRGFEIFVPDLRREDFDPTIFERALTRVAGLARLLVLEKLSTQDARDGYIDQRRQMRGRPKIPRSRRRGRGRRDDRLKGDLKSAEEFGGLQMSDYDVMFHIPYGPGIDSKKISKIVYQTDLGMNSTFNPKNKGRRLHRHPAFFGNMKEALEDCCEYCPVPETDEEKENFEKEQERYITGRVAFLQEDPGRQSITGSFRPIDSGEWSEQAYLKPITKLFSFIASHNRTACNDFLKRNAEAINTRDHLGRSPLQFALLCSAEDICLDLIEQGGRMVSRTVDGRCSLHLAAQMGLPKVVKALLEKSEKNKAEKEAKEKEAKKNEGKDKDVEMKDGDDEVRDSSEDDWSTEDDDNEDEDYEEARKKVDVKEGRRGEQDALDESEDEPDILDINAPDWDQSLNALGYAIIGGSLPIVQLLVAAGADCKTPSNIGNSSTTSYPLSLTELIPDEAVAAQIAEHLVTAGGASFSAADSDTVTVFHRLVVRNKPQIVETLLRVDPTAKVASRFLYARTWSSAVHPIVSAFANGHRAMVAILLAYAGSRAYVDLETYDRSVAADPNKGYSYARAGEENWKECTSQPLEVALADYNDLYRLVLDLEPESVKNSVPKGVYQRQNNEKLRRSMLDFLHSAVRELKRRSREPAAPTTAPVTRPSKKHTSPWRSIFDLSDLEISEGKEWDAHAIAWEKRRKALCEPAARDDRSEATDSSDRAKEERRAQAAKLLSYFQQAVEDLEKAGARTWDEIYKDLPSQWKLKYGFRDFDPDDPNAQATSDQTSEVSRFLVFGEVDDDDEVTEAAGASASESTEETIEETAKPFKRYSLFVAGWGEDYPGTHLIPLYDELFEACWKSDNDKIRALCLPPEDDSAPPPSGIRDLLQITARVKYTDLSSNYSEGYTPLYVAIRARKWDTARLILDIAQKQLMEEDEDEDNNKPETTNRGGNVIRFVDDDDSEDGSDAESYASDETEKRPAGYTDLAKRFHTVHVLVKPSQLLSFEAKCAIERTSAVEEYTGTADPITVAVRENDAEAFAQIADMMENLAQPMSIPESLRDIILENDTPDMLDAYIRRTGDGLLLPKPKAKESSKAQAHHDDDDDDEHKIYLGLNVNGKKRKDLARREDPNAPYEHDDECNVPIGWRAASAQAIAILEYLNGPKAIEAYKHYAETHKTKLAKRLTEALQNPDDFPKMVGFSVSRLAETPVLAAIWNPPNPDRILSTLKKLMELQPRLTADGIRLQVKPNRMSAFLFLCSSTTFGAPIINIFDWLLANGADPLIREERGCNIFHLMFSPRNLEWELIEHALAKLPADVIQVLMVQQTYTSRNTPFASAVKKGNLRLVELLVRTVKSAIVRTLLLRDSTGATPLHSAILGGWSKIVSRLISIGPPEMLYLENGVGSTPMEMARLPVLAKTLSKLGNSLEQPDTFDIDGVDNLDLTPAPGMRDRDEQEVKSLRRVIEGIRTSGALAKRPELFEVLRNFADRSEHEFAAWVTQKPKEEVQTTPAETDEEYDECKVKATFNVFSGAVVEVHQRQLVHLSDVQRAVLSAVESQPNGPLRTRWGGKVPVEGLGEDEPDQQEDGYYSVILGHPSN